MDKWKMKQAQVAMASKTRASLKTSTSKSISLKTVKSAISELFLRFLSRLKSFKQSLDASILRPLAVQMNRLRNKIHSSTSRLIGPMEKGMKAAELSQPPVGVYEGVDLRVLPKFICFKAAMLKSKVTIQYMLGAVVLLFIGREVATSLRLAEYERLLRKKEYILAPGVLDFTKASAQSVPSGYVNDAVNDFLGKIGNVNPVNIEEQYTGLAKFMGPKLKVKFQAEIQSFVEQVKEENISQILTITDKEITTDDKGSYKVVAFGRVDLYADGESIGYEDRVFEMLLELTAPTDGKRWYLQLNQLSWTKADTFKRKQQIERKEKNSVTNSKGNSR